MSTESNDDTGRHALTHKRDLIVNRLTRALGAIDRKRRAVTHVVEDVAALVPRSSDPPGAPAAGGAARNALLGAAAGGLVAAVALLVQHRQRERRRPIKLLQRAWFRYAMPPRPSLLSRLVTEAVGSLVMSVASEAARAIVTRALEAADEQRGPEILDRVSDVPEVSFVTSPMTGSPTASSPDSALAPTGIAPPDPIAPLPSPLREFA
jgi:hypothetical protein